MTQSNEPNDRRLDRTLRSISRRVSRLEDTQVTWNELNVEFDRIYDEIDERFNALEARFNTLEAQIAQRFDSQDAKIDIILRHITASGNS